MRHRGYKIPQPRVPVFWQACLAVAFWIGIYYAASFIVAGLINLIGSIV